MTKNWFFILFSLVAMAYSGLEVIALYKTSKFSDMKIFLMLALFIASASIYFKYFLKERIKKK